MDRYFLQVTLLLLVAALAYFKGGSSEKRVAVVLVSMHVVSAIQYFLFSDWEGLVTWPIFRMSLDLVGFLAILYIALRANRWWPLWVGSAQLLAIMAHVFRAIDANLPMTVYLIMERWPFWAAITITGIGTVLHARRERDARIAS
ncbi:hypothetical protein [Qipengyuania psychrotolerans]|uniref:Uncharacterized protein n=1 Tax=Qipengyuania psychrotolerans TaxID=2867238 RepID=A0ABX8ZJ04_9SPHN|nr:hypothetical protein [Qipengyuania psychrotolerans]QZD87659.1 hypothetical protein K3166_02860 [Qipengyuania psychrotolerans]